MIRTVFSLIIVLASIYSCSDHDIIVGGTPRPSIEINIDTTQVVLTNEYAFKDGRYSKGAASFLVKGKNDTFLCTAKHLLGEALGISPEIRTSEFNQQLSYWNSYSSNPDLFKDTLEIRSIVNRELNQVDIILLKTEQKVHGITTLTPSFSKPKIGQKLDLIAVERGSTNQKKFEMSVYKYSNNSLIVKAKKPFNPSLMSGSPVLNKKGYVIGVLVGGGMFEGDLYMTVEPLILVKTHFN